MKKFAKRILVVASISALGLAAQAANASLTPTFTGVTGTGPFTFSYTVGVAADQNAQPGPGTAPGSSVTTGVGVSGASSTDFFTVYDFRGFTGVHSEPAGWGFESLLLGATPSDTLPADDPTIANLTWFRTGATVNGPATLTGFSAQSTLNTTAVDNYTSDATRNSGAAAGTAISSIGTTIVPAATAVPEPGMMLLLSAGLAGLGVVSRRKGR